MNALDTECSRRGSSKPGCRLIIHRTRSVRPASRISWKMTTPLKPLSASLAADSRTTKLYDRLEQKVLLEDMLGPHWPFRNESVPSFQRHQWLPGAIRLR